MVRKERKQNAVDPDMYVPDVRHNQTLSNDHTVSYVEGENNRFIRKETVVSL
jgi:hypothetical protein